jgi:hypothetical protein
MQSEQAICAEVDTIQPVAGIRHHPETCAAGRQRDRAAGLRVDLNRVAPVLHPMQ